MWLAAVLLVGCPESSDAAGATSFGGGDEGCWETEEVPLDHPTAPGPSGADLLARVAEAFEVTAFVLPNPPGVEEYYDDATGQHELTLTFEAAGDFATAPSTECWTNEEPSPAFVEVPARVRMTSADG